MLSMGVYSNKSVRKGVGHPRISSQDLGFRKNKDFLLEYTPMMLSSGTTLTVLIGERPVLNKVARGVKYLIAHKDDTVRYYLLSLMNKDIAIQLLDTDWLILFVKF